MCKDIIRKEIRFAVHLPKTDYRQDAHYVRLDTTCKCGKQEPKTALIKDFKRDIYVSKQSARNHKEKKEFEYLENLHKQETTQSELNQTVSKLLGIPPSFTNDNIKNSPYVYGYDVTSTSLIKLTSLKKNDFIQSPYSTAYFDIETDTDTQEIIVATITYNGKSHTSILSKLVKNISNLQERAIKATHYYLPKYINSQTTFTVHDNEVDLLKDVFKVANDWKPVFLAIWNMDYDIPKILERLQHHSVNPVDVICDTSIPRAYRVCRYKQGVKKKVTSSGVVKPINPSLQWHTLISTTAFYVIDSMCVYRQLRISEQEEPSYSLNAILKKELNTQKLSFKEADQYQGLAWHVFMRENYPIEYIVYNIYDCLSMGELDAKTKDLSSTLPSFAGITDFAKFNSQVRKISDAVFLFGLDRGRVIGTSLKPVKEEDEIDESLLKAVDEEEDEDLDVSKHKTLDLKGWIQLLPQNLLLHNGLKCIEEYPDMVTNLRGLVCDLDASSSYPSCTLVSNVSKETCVNEVISITNIREETFREQNLSICLGNVNLLEYFNVIFDMPSIDEIDALIE